LADNSVECANGSEGSRKKESFKNANLEENLAGPAEGGLGAKEAYVLWEGS